ncbi:MAG: YkgJ family cysteine cluster protein [Nitrospirota bacterium]|nr:YkgJ family cysteine cluster protein [Nitrospirota bacterium]
MSTDKDNREDGSMPDEPDELQISDTEKQRIINILNKMMELGIGSIYGEEEEGVPDALVDCASRIRACRAACCTFTFALTKDEVKKGMVKHNPDKPFFIARNAEGYCTHLDISTLTCTIWEDRPLRCRRYDCSEDGKVKDIPEI